MSHDDIARYKKDITDSLLITTTYYWIMNHSAADLLIVELVELVGDM